VGGRRQWSKVGVVGPGIEKLSPEAVGLSRCRQAQVLLSTSLCRLPGGPCMWMRGVSNGSCPMICARMWRGTVTALAFGGSEKGCGNRRWLKDLDGDRVPEVIVKQFIGEYQGAATQAVWPAILGWDRATYRRADASSPRYYAERVVPYYQRELSRTRGLALDHPDEELCRQFQYIIERARALAEG
jgi:hypothetical protein